MHRRQWHHDVLLQHHRPRTHKLLFSLDIILLHLICQKDQIVLPAEQQHVLDVILTGHIAGWIARVDHGNALDLNSIVCVVLVGTLDLLDVQTP